MQKSKETNIMENEIKKNKNREILISLSRKAKQIRIAKTQKAKSENEALFWSTRTVNQILMMVLYNPKKDKTFKTFHQWLKEGKTIIKGSKGIAVWAQPLGKLKFEKAAAKGEKIDVSDDEMRFFPMCYLFSDSQVLERKEAIAC